MFDAPRGPGPYGITTTPDGAVYYASLAGSHIARIDLETGQATPIDPPTPARARGGSGRTRRAGSGSASGTPARSAGTTRPRAAGASGGCPATRPQPYAVYVDERDVVWLSDFGANALVRFDPRDRAVQSFPLPSATARVRQLLGRPGEVWGAESGADKLVVVRPRR